jgi:4-hydroxybenzoate polyprenyltransferase
VVQHWPGLRRADGKIWMAGVNPVPPNTSVADAAPGNWVERWLPAPLLPYAQLMRLDRPIGWWLLLIPCWWGLGLAALTTGPQAIQLWYATLFLAGAVIMRGAGCVINDIADRNFDGQVARTRSRPIPSGRVSVKQALVFLGLLLLAGLAILVQFNTLTILTGLASVAIIVIYPLMKRITYWPQAVLGLAFNWGALVGWTAVTNTHAWPSLMLYAAGISWTLAYDTIYAHQDKDDDILIGVKSTALKFGSNTRPWLTGFFALTTLLLALAAWGINAGPATYAGIAAAALQSVWQIRAFDDADGGLCLQLFKSNRTYGLLVLAGFLMDLLI